MNSGYVLALTTAALMAIGQVLFKLGADKLKTETLSDLAISFFNPYLIVAIVLYALTILIWIYVLKIMPLSVAYPITALAFIVVPILSSLILGEKLTLQTIIGSVLIIAGIATINLQKA